MELLDSILSAVSGKSDTSGEAAPLIGILSGLLAQSGGLQGLANKFSQSGQGDAFSSWVGMGENQSVSSNQIQQALGSGKVDPTADHQEGLTALLPSLLQSLGGKSGGDQSVQA